VYLFLFASVMAETPASLLLKKQLRGKYTIFKLWKYQKNAILAHLINGLLTRNAIFSIHV